MINIYECSDGSTVYYEIYNERYEYQATLDNDSELSLYLDVLKSNDVRYVVHTLKQYEEGLV